MNRKLNRAMASKKGKSKGSATTQITTLLNTLAPNLQEMGSRLQEVGSLETHLEGVRAEWEKALGEIRGRIDDLERRRRIDYFTMLALVLDLSRNELRVNSFGELVERAAKYWDTFDEGEKK